MSKSMTLEEYRKYQEQYFPNSDGRYLADAAVVFYSAGLQLLGGQIPPHTPTTWNVLTGERRLSQDMTREADIMAKGREAAYDADEIDKGVIDYAKKSAIRGDFALAYTLAWNLNQFQQQYGEPHISDLPTFMELCLNLLRPTAPKEILELATSCVQYLPEDPVVSPMLRKVLSEYSNILKG